MNKKHLLLGLLAIGSLGITSCEKDEIAALNNDIETLEAQVVANDAASNAADAALQAQIDALRAELSARIEEINNSLLAAIAANGEEDDADNQAQADALAAAQALLQAAIDLNSSLDAASDSAQANALADASEALNALIAANASANEDLADALAAAEASLSSAIASGDALAIAAAASDLADAVAAQALVDADQDADIDSLQLLAIDLQSQLNDLDIPAEASVTVSGSILTLTIGDMSWDIDQSGGADGSNGQNGANGQAGSNGQNGANGANGADGADGNGIDRTEYDSSTGILTIYFTDGTSFSTGDLRGPAGQDGTSGSGSVAITWGPELGTQIADFTQTGNLDGAELSRLVSVVAGSPVDVLGGETMTVTYNGLSSLQAAQDAITAVGTHTIAVVTTTVVADGVRSITYTATADNGNIAVGSHTVTSVIAGSTNSVNSSVEYVVAPEAPTYADAQYGSYGPAFGNQRDNFIQTASLVNGSDVAPGTAATITRTIVVSGTPVTQYSFGGDARSASFSGDRLFSNIVDAEAGAQALANTANVPVYVFSRVSTTYRASFEGSAIGTPNTVAGSKVKGQGFNPVSTGPVDADDDTISWGNFSEDSRSEGAVTYVYAGTSYNSLADAQAAAELALDINTPYSIDVNTEAGSYVESRQVIYSQGADGFDDDLTIAREDGSLAGEGDSETVTRQIAATSVPMNFTTSEADASSIVPTWTDGSIDAAAVIANGSAVSSVFSHNVYAQSFTITETEDFLGNFFQITYSANGGNAIAADATEYGSLAEAVTAAKAAIVAAQ